MYNPRIRPELIALLYRLKKYHNKPMTKELEELLESSIKNVDKDAVCKMCIKNQINSCEDCFLANL